MVPQIKLADFGLARSAQTGDGREGKLDLTNNVVTMWYKSPELLLGSQTYSYGVDVWAAGCVLAELELRRPIFPGKTEVEQLDLLCKALGTPTQSMFPGMQELPYHDKYMRHIPVSTSTLKDTALGKLISPAALGLLDRVLVMDPTKRCSARSALSSRYFLSAPQPPEDPSVLPPLAPGANLHEYASKQKKKDSEKARKIQEELTKIKGTTGGSAGGVSATGYAIPSVPSGVSNEMPLPPGPEHTGYRDTGGGVPYQLPPAPTLTSNSSSLPPWHQLPLAPSKPMAGSANPTRQQQHHSHYAERRPGQQHAGQRIKKSNTILCQFFQQGRCRKGTNCTFQHANDVEYTQHSTSNDRDYSASQVGQKRPL